MWSWLSGKAQCPASPPEKALVEERFHQLELTLGRSRLLNAQVIEPTDRFFPDAFDASPEAIARLFARVCHLMAVDPRSVELSFFRQDHAEAAAAAPGSLPSPTRSQGAAGYYVGGGRKAQVYLNLADAADPEALVATMAHELAHVILLGQHGRPADEPHMEALTDLATIYLGLGIFTANSLLRRHGWTEGNLEGWSVQRKGYISPEMAGWALALFCWARGERNPSWRHHLAADPKGYLKRGLRYLEQTGNTTYR